MENSISKTLIQVVVRVMLILTVSKGPIYPLSKSVTIVPNELNLALGL